MVVWIFSLFLYIVLHRCSSYCAQSIFQICLLFHCRIANTEQLNIHSESLFKREKRDFNGIVLVLDAAVCRYILFDDKFFLSWYSVWSKRCFPSAAIPFFSLSQNTRIIFQFQYVSINFLVMFCTQL